MLKATREKRQMTYIQGDPHNIISWFLSRNSAGQSNRSSRLYLKWHKLKAKKNIKKKATTYMGTSRKFISWFFSKETLQATAELQAFTILPTLTNRRIKNTYDHLNKCRKGFEKNEHWFMIKSSPESGNRGNLPQSNKGHRWQTHSEHHFNGEKLQFSF